MKRFFKAGILVVALLSCVALAGAQQGQGGGRGQGRGGRNNTSELGLAMRADVQKDLAVTDDQKTKLTEYSDKQRAARRAAGGGGRGNGGGAAGGTFDREAFMKAQEEARAQTHKDLAAILNEGQMKRLGEISIQLQGNRALTNAEVQKSLGLSEDQITKIKDLATKMQEANRGLQEKVRSQEMTREESQAAMAKNNATMNAELAKILTADQAAKLKAMGGKPFVADPPAGGGGGF